MLLCLPPSLRHTDENEERKNDSYNHRFQDGLSPHKRACNFRVADKKEEPMWASLHIHLFRLKQNL